MDNNEKVWARFLKRCQPKPNGCIEWSNPTHKDGYGYFKFEGKNRIAHRMAWFLRYGEWPKGRLLHSCDNPPCVNVEHLREGSQQDNVREMFEKNRHLLSTSKCRKRKRLTIEQVLEIRRLAAEGWSVTKLAKAYNLSRSSMSLVVNRKSWAWVEEK